MDPSDFAAAVTVGAFPFASTSADSALLLTLDPGAYTAQVNGADATSTGLALVEVYEVSAGNSTLLNLSTRANIGTCLHRHVHRHIGTCS